MDVEAEAGAAGVEEVEVEEEDEDWFCGDCLRGKHPCILCGKYGADGKLGPRGVHKCQQMACGRYYHTGCLRAWVDEERAKGAAESSLSLSSQETTDTDKALARVLERLDEGTFICPLHRCAVCGASSSGGRKAGKGGSSCGLHPCMQCPRSYHVQCLPPSALFDDYSMHCPHHRDVPLPLQPAAWLTEKTLASGGGGAGGGIGGGVNAGGSTSMGAGPSRLESAFISLLCQLPHKPPRVDQAKDLHYRLPGTFLEDIDNMAPQFQQLKSNLYVCQAKHKMPHFEVTSGGKITDVPNCVCPEGGACGDQCMNRVLNVECVGGADITNRIVEGVGVDAAGVAGDTDMTTVGGKPGGRKGKAKAGGKGGGKEGGEEGGEECKEGCPSEDTKGHQVRQLPLRPELR